jgi:quercetin dioxygenase-like cupin family protein
MVMRVINISESPSDESLTPSGGWVEMDLKWLVTEGSLYSKYTTFGRTLFAPGGSSKHALHKHNNAEEIIMVLKGHGESIIDKDNILMGPGDVCYIPMGVPHSFMNLSKDEACEIIFIYGGAPSLEKAGYELV